ncbi:hypothetical protein BAU08_01870 [Bordetella bronchialis]|uniref:Uncharacterized protein n=1 Tax=Bordetella bronchialis TaxID=463025 RepID=A0A193FT79_9BORD|nr:hypothetical protein BAU08_01870 [Bordetella bronchialis]
MVIHAWRGLPAGRSLAKTGVARRASVTEGWGEQASRVRAAGQSISTELIGMAAFWLFCLTE